MTAYIVMGVIIVWAGASIPFVQYLERKDSDKRAKRDSIRHG